MISFTWKLKAPDPGAVAAVAAALQISPTAASVLVNRGMDTPEAARDFLNPSIEGLHNPFLLPDIYPAVDRIRAAVDRKEKILVYGDRDVDGVTSICVMVRTLVALGADVAWYIPSDEGYGLHNDIIKRYADQGITLIVTVDCGISAMEETSFASGLGIDMVVTDHHESPSTGIPRAVAVVDPKRADASYPFTELAGCSVSFKVAEALMQSYGRYYNRSLVFVSADRENGSVSRIAAVKTRNGVVLGSFDVPAFASVEDAWRSFEGFCGNDAVLVRSGSSGQGDPLPALLENGPAEGKRQVIIAEDLLVRIPDEDKEARDTLSAAFSGLAHLPAGKRSDALRILYSRAARLSDLRMRFFQTGHMDVVALGTIADIMPLHGENRILVKTGLKELARSSKPGVKVLLERSSARSKADNGWTAKMISWNITPLLNAAGRRGRADLAAELLLTEKASRAGELLNEIEKLNSERRELQAENMEKFVPLLCEQCDVDKDKIFIVTAAGLEHGVTGIIASQLMRQYRRPTILLIIDGNEAMGAARSVEGFDMVGALDSVKDILVKYGGHSQAAGLTITVDKLDEFRRRVTALADEKISPELLAPSIESDAEVPYNSITMGLHRELSSMEPFGMGNPPPVFIVRGVKIREHSRVGANGAHLRLKVSRNGGSVLPAIAWGMGDMDDVIDNYPAADLAAQIDVNTWQDRHQLQLLVQDIKPGDY